MAGRGFNTIHGFDNGPPPPGIMQGAPNMQYAQPQQAYVVPQNYPTQQFYGYPPPHYAQQSYPQGLVPQHPSYRPPEGPVPGVHLRNHTGGVGVPPGYDYIFPLEHTKIHIFTTSQKPWEATGPLYNTQIVSAYFSLPFSFPSSPSKRNIPFKANPSLYLATCQSLRPLLHAHQTSNAKSWLQKQRSESKHHYRML